MVLSVQMYSLRGDVERDGLDSVLSKIKKSGFDGVELAGTYGFEPTELSKKLDDNGLVVTGAHVGFDLLSKSVAECVDTAAALGYHDIICPWLDKSLFTVETAEKFARMIEELPPEYRLGYHNHAHEFENGDFLKLLYDNVPKMLFEPDTFWLKVADKDVVGYCRSLAPRVMALHLKELSPAGKDDFNPLPGEGVTGCASVVKLAREFMCGYIVLEAEKMGVPFDEYLASTAEFCNAILED